MLPMRSIVTVQPASSHQRIKRRRASPSRSLAASRQTPPFAVAPIRANSIRLAHSRSPLIVRLRMPPPYSEPRLSHRPGSRLISPANSVQAERTMQAWYHCENVYPFVPQEVLDRAESVRASLPNRYCDPKIAADLFHECLDEHLLCDHLGVNIVSIEHHSGINSLYGASTMILGIIARQTKKVRILSLGTLVSVRPDPVRIAEEYATADVLSRGRLEIGFVKSGDSEMVSGNANPVGYVDRFWEAMDVIKLALTSHDGPVSYEGKHFTHRHINIWPPAYQRPHPRFWAATGDPETSAELGRRGYINALVLRGPEASKRAFDSYRKARQDAGLPAPGTDKFAYAALCYVGDTDEEGLEVGSKLLWFLNTSLKQSPQMSGDGAQHLAHHRRARPPGRSADRHHPRARDRARHPRRRQSRHGLSADHGHLRQGGRVCTFHLCRPLRLPDA